jgi:transporter family-2 protein
MTWLPALAAFLGGSALAVQVGLNNGLRSRMGHPIPAALTSFATGTVALLAYMLLTRPGWPERSSLASAPAWIWLGGIVGAGYIVASATFAPRLGAGGWLALVIAGQILASVALDHYGLVGFRVRPFSLGRGVGVALLLVGVVVVLRT